MSRGVREKRNEQVRLAATFFNGVAIATAALGLIAPFVQGGAFNPIRVWIAVVIAYILHTTAQALIALLWRAEEPGS